MIKNFTALSFAVFPILFFSQIGINTPTPQSTFDITLQSPYNLGNVAGVSFPQLTGDQIENIVTTNLKAGTLIYATEPSSNLTEKDIDSIGYWYWSGNQNKKWEPLFLSHKTVVSYFYAPSIVLPTSSLGISPTNTPHITYNSGTYQVNLYSLYREQYSMEGINSSPKFAVKNNNADSLPTFESIDLDYYITYFDNTVFEPSSITISDNGILSYNVVNNPVITEKTYMNIVFKVK